MKAAVALTGSGDVRDMHWLSDRITAIEDGMEAVVDIARNWSDGRNLARLFPGVSAADYITERVGPLGKAAVPVLLTESNWSAPQIAAVAGVSDETVYRVARSTNVERGPVLGADNKVYPPRPRVSAPRLNPQPYQYGPRVVEAVVIDTPTEVEPIDSESWRSLIEVMRVVDGLTSSDAAEIAATVPNRRRAATAKKLRKLGTYLGSIAWSLEREEYIP